MKELSSLRAEIDQLDEQLWEIIAQRVDVAREIGEWKRAHGEQIVQPERWQQVMQHCQQVGLQYGLSEKVINEVMSAIHTESIRVES
ncbi:MAG: chorismate mutase [Paludibacteraceae bacterium]|nr:chorismate mutase [Paludibacteraceae bacterium]